MSEPTFLDTAAVEVIHLDQVDRYGGSKGLRDRAALESAVVQPRAGFGGAYLHGDLFAMAAAYWFHISQNHPFLDGNKRAAYATAMTFLFLNGFIVEADDEAKYALAMRIAQGEAPKAEIAEFLKAHAIAVVST